MLLDFVLNVRTEIAFETLAIQGWKLVESGDSV